MKTFSLVRMLRPSYITKDLIKLLEDYLLNQVPKMLSIEQNLIKKSYTISITDDLGTEVLSSIAEFPFPLFSDSTREILLEFEIAGPTITLQLSIRFADSKTSRISLKCSSDNPRENASAVYDGIKRILESVKTSNVLLYPPQVVQGFIFLSVLGLTLLGAQLVSAHFETAGHLILIFVAFLIVFFAVGTQLNPYIAFDSNSTTNKKKWSDRFLWFLISGLVLSSLFTILRKNLFGF